MESKLISIIIPIYNGENWLCNAVDSALNQTYSKIEVLLINDGSTDNSFGLIQKYQSDSRVRIFNTPNGGQAKARNLGIEKATGSYIQFLDCDDTLETNALERAFAAMKDSTDFVLYGLNIYHQGQLLRTPHCEQFSYNGQYDLFRQVSRLLDSPCNKLYKKDYIKNKFPESCVYGEDGIFNYSNLSENTKIESIPDCLYNVRLDNPNSVNKRYKPGRLRDTIKYLSVGQTKMVELFGKNSINNDYMPAFLSTLSFTVLLSASKSSLSDFKKELKECIYTNRQFSIYNNKMVNKAIPTHNRLVLFLLQMQMTTSLFLLARFIRAIGRI